MRVGHLAVALVGMGPVWRKRSIEHAAVRALACLGAAAALRCTGGAGQRAQVGTLLAAQEAASDWR